MGSGGLLQGHRGAPVSSERGVATPVPHSLRALTTETIPVVKGKESRSLGERGAPKESRGLAVGAED